MILPTANCMKALVAVEAQPYGNKTVYVDNPGGVGVVTLTGNITNRLSYSFVGFESFDDK